MDELKKEALERSHDDEDEHDHEHGHCCHHDHDDGGEDEHDHEHEHGHCHHHHHADEVFDSWGVETPKAYTAEELKAILSQLTNAVEYGTVLRAKGIVPSRDGKWLHFDYNPGEPDVHEGCPAYTGRLCVIGSKLDKEELAELFGVE